MEYGWATRSSRPSSGIQKGKRNRKPSWESVCVCNSFHDEFQMVNTNIWILKQRVVRLKDRGVGPGDVVQTLTSMCKAILKLPISCHSPPPQTITLYYKASPYTNIVTEEFILTEGWWVCDQAVLLLLEFRVYTISPWGESYFSVYIKYKDSVTVLSTSSFQALIKFYLKLLNYTLFSFPSLQPPLY